MVCEAGSGQPGALALRPLHVFGCEVLHTVQANLQVAFYNHFPNAGHWLMSFARSGDLGVLPQPGDPCGAVEVQGGGIRQPHGQGWLGESRTKV